MTLINNRNFGVRRQMIFSLVIILSFASYSFGLDKFSILIPHLLTAVGTAYIFDSIIKYIYKKRIYFNETSLITGLIVASVIDPTTPLLLTGFISIVGIASKNFLTIKKRHIFNPAAFGIVFVGLIFPDIFQSWWIGGEILPIIILGSLLLYRLGRILTFVSYLITFFILKFSFDYFSGNLLDIFSNFWISLSKFFIFFMLIEPQTSPSTKGKKIIFGVFASLFTFVFLNLPVLSSLEQNGILIGLLLVNIYFILSQFYKESQVKIISNFMLFLIFITVLSYSNSGTNNLQTDKTLNNISKETNNMIDNMKNMGSDMSMMKVLKLDKSYMSPGGKDKVLFKISTVDDKIVSVITEIKKANKTSDKYIVSFNENINGFLKGKTIREAKDIDTIGGASLTTNAFKSAIQDL